MEQLRVIDLSRYIGEKEIELTKEIDNYNVEAKVIKEDKLSEEDRIHIEAYEKLIEEVGDLQEYYEFINT